MLPLTTTEWFLILNVIVVQPFTLNEWLYDDGEGAEFWLQDIAGSNLCSVIISAEAIHLSVRPSAHLQQRANHADLPCKGACEDCCLRMWTFCFE